MREESIMSKKYFTAAYLLALIALLMNFQSARAHESITVGDYEIVYGWVNEPPIAGQLNGVELFITNTSGGEPAEEHIIDSMTVELTYGGETKALTLEPGFEEPGTFRATVLPTIPGLYSLDFSGTLEGTTVDTEVELEEVQAADVVQFPGAASTQQQPADTGVADWLIWFSLLLGLLGVGLSAIALTKRR
jgi:hypothetical protein